MRNDSTRLSEKIWQKKKHVENEGVANMDNARDFNVVVVYR